MSSCKQLGGDGAAQSAGSILKSKGFGKIRERLARYALVREILAENLGDIVAQEHYDLILRGKELEVVADTPAHAEMLRQSLPLADAALKRAGIASVRLANRRG